MKTGEFIKKLRTDKGMTQEDLAAKTNISARTIQRIENGDVEARAYTLQTIAAALGVSFRELAGCDEQDLEEANSRSSSVWLPLLHLSGLFVLLFPPLIIWIWKRNQIEEMQQHGIDVINFQLSMLIFLVPCGILAGLIITIPVIILLGLFSTIVILINTIKVANEQAYSYPLSMRILKS